MLLSVFLVGELMETRREGFKEFIIHDVEHSGI